MPAVSPAQKRLMAAAAHTEGGYGGVSQAVGREFTGADEAPDWVTNALDRALSALDASFNEGDRPRAQNGQFGGGGSGGSVKGLTDHPIGKMRDYTAKELDWEYGTEYQKYSKSFAPKAFSSREDFQKKFDAAPLRHLTHGEYHSLQNTSGLSSIANSGNTLGEKEADVRKIIGARRDVGRIMTDLDEGRTAPPIVLKKGGTLRLMAGNTRLISSAARELNLPVKVIDVTEKKDQAHDGWFCLAADEAPLGPFATQEMAERVSSLIAGALPPGLALDRASGRIYDQDGRLRLDACNISKACVSPYKGSEIPGCKALGLDGAKVYQMLRDPEELAKAAPSFNMIPVMSDHVAVSAADHRPDLMVGTTGTDCRYAHPYLVNSLGIFAQKAIDGIEDDAKRELSCGYYYKPDMTPGVYEGVSYDGVMREIRGNHVALVSEGRAGPDVLVGDEALKIINKERQMSKKPIVLRSRAALRVQGALIAHYAPMLAQDARPDFTTILKEVNLKTFGFKKMRDAVAKAAFDAALPMMEPEAKAAAGAGPDDVIMKILEMLPGQMGGGEEGAAPDPAAMKADALPEAAAPGSTTGTEGSSAGGSGGGTKEKVMQWAKAQGIADDAMGELDGMFGEAPKKPAAEDEGPEGETEEEKKMRMDKKAKDAAPAITPAAMDAALKKHGEDIRRQVVADQRELQEARDEVRPHVGEVSQALDSAEAVRRAGLKAMGVDGVDEMHADALRPLLRGLPKPGAKKNDVPAMDAKRAQTLHERFPNAARISA